MKEEKLDAKLEALAKRKRALVAQERQLFLQTRKQKEKKFFEFGRLVSEAGLFDMDQTSLLGALIEVKESAQDPANLSRWQALGSKCHQDREFEDGTRMTIRFEDSVSNEVLEHLRTHKFRYNKFRREWQGCGSKEKLAKLLKSAKPHIEVLIGK